MPLGILSKAIGVEGKPLSYNTPGIRIFPTYHPFTKNKDGSVSNVVISGEDILDKDGKYLYTVAFPTMINGKQYSKSQAFDIAKSQGIDKYPKFKSIDEMNSWAKTYHSMIDESGVLMKKPIEELISSAKKQK